MVDKETFYPKEENLGKNCQSWNLEGRFKGCNYPNAKLEGRTSCEGIIDDVCLYLRTGGRAESLTEEQILKLKLNPPTFGQKYDIPPGDFGPGPEPDPEPIKPDPLTIRSPIEVLR